MHVLKTYFIPTVSDLERAIAFVPFKYLFWVILEHFKLCFKRKRNKET